MRAFLFLHAIRLITSFLYSSTACVHIYYVLALFCVHSYCASALSLCASLLHSSTCLLYTSVAADVLPPYIFIIPNIFSVRISTVFQHCRREFLLHCSTLCMHLFRFPVLSAYISIVLQFACISFGYSTFREAFWTALGGWWTVQRSGKISLLL